MPRNAPTKGRKKKLNQEEDFYRCVTPLHSQEVPATILVQPMTCYYYVHYSMPVCENSNKVCTAAMLFRCVPKPNEPTKMLEFLTYTIRQGEEENVSTYSKLLFSVKNVVLSLQLEVYFAPVQVILLCACASNYNTTTTPR